MAGHGHVKPVIRRATSLLTLLAQLALAILCISCISCSSTTLPEVRLTRLLLGTTVTITVRHADEAFASKAITAALDEIERIEQLMSSYDEESEIWCLNSTGVIESDPEILRLIEEARRFSRLSDGAFDVTVQPLLDLYDTAFSQRGRPPTPAEIETARQKVGFERIRIAAGRISLPEGMKITLGGIAKGYAIDRAVSVLQERGVRHGLVNAGGDMRSLGTKDGGPWKIALQNPRNSHDYIALLPLADRAVATSGDYEKFFDPEKKFHHIVDPRTGYSATELISVTVVAPTALEADALATAVFVLGAQQGMELIECRENVEALLVTAERAILTSTGLDYSLLSGEP